MKLIAVVALLVPNFAVAAFDADKDNSVIVLESFDDPIHEWQELNDPVMGGKSTGTFKIQNGLGVFEGDVVDVPFLKAPGFIQAHSTSDVKYPDVSKCTGLEIVAKSNTDYAGYRISFGTAHAPGGKFFARGYKANLDGISTDSFSSVIIPFHQFTDFWDDATGDPIHTCAENDLYCPDELTLKNMRTIVVWGEGVAGTVSLEIKTIRAVQCAA